MSEKQPNSLPRYYMTIEPTLFLKLNEDVKADLFIPSTLRINNELYPIEIAYRGAHTRKFVKKSFHVKCTSPELCRGEKEFHLNAEFMDPSIMRNKLSFDFFTEIGVLAPKAQHILLHINDGIVGIYLKLESVDEFYLQKRGLPTGPIYYAVNSDANFSLIQARADEVKESLEAGYDRKYGTDADDDYLRELVYKINTTPRASFEETISKIVDVDNYLRWLSGVICTQNFDGFIHNYALYRNSQTKQFYMIPWDYDGTWGRNFNGKELNHTYLTIDGYNTLTARILDVPSFRKQYCNILQEILNTTFTVEHMEPKITELYTMLRPYVLLDPYKKDSIDKFDAEPEFILTFIQNRNEFLRNSIEDFKTINSEL